MLNENENGVSAWNTDAAKEKDMNNRILRANHAAVNDRNELRRIRRALVDHDFLLLSHAAHGERYYYLVPDSRFSRVNVNHLASRLMVNDPDEEEAQFERKVLLLKMERGDEGDAISALLAFRQLCNGNGGAR